MRSSISLILILIAVACGNNSNESQSTKKSDRHQMKEALIEANRSAVAAEEEMILNFAQRHNWPVKKVSGIYFVRYKEGTGPEIDQGDEVRYHYTLSLINGKQIASSSESAPSRILVGSGGSDVSGLHRAMQYLKQGDNAKVLVPSHLAYGIAGNQENIPSKATLIYDVRIIQVSKP